MLATLDQLKERLAIPAGSEPSDTPDAYLTAVVARAESLVRSRASNRQFTYPGTSTVEYGDGHGGTVLNLREGPVRTGPSALTVEKVEYDGTNESYVVVDANDYRVRGLETEKLLVPGWIVRVSGRWDPGIRNYRVVYHSGWDPADTPATRPLPVALTQIALDVAVYIHINRKDTGLESRAVADGDMSGFRGWAEMMADVDAVLGPFNPPRVF